MKRVRNKVLSLFIVMFVFWIPLVAFASGGNSQLAYSELGQTIVAGSETVTSAYKIVDPSKTYTTTGGGFVAYSSLVSATEIETGFIVESNFSLLTSSAKREFLQDMWDVANASSTASVTITDDTLSMWGKNLQQCAGVDAQLLAVLMSGTKPDFIGAMKIYAPFQSPAGIVMGVATLILFGLLTFSTLLDIFYIGVPPFNALISSDKQEKPPMVSAAAYTAYMEEVGSSNGGSASGGKLQYKPAIWTYLKRRTAVLVVIFISILYLVSGAIWGLLGDALSFFGGFR